MTSSSTSPSHTLERQQLRSQLRAQRLQLTPRFQADAARQLALHFVRTSLYRRSKHIALYWAHRGEISLAPLLQASWRAGKVVYLPCLGEGREMSFRRYRPGDRLLPNRFNIPEPCDNDGERCALELDLIVVPLVAYDRSGRRLGTGGGYYDWNLRNLRRRQGTPVLVGAAYSAQEVNCLPGEPWDVPVHGVTTERGYRPSRR